MSSWAPTYTFLAVAGQHGEPDSPPAKLEVCWHRSQPESFHSAEATLAKQLLAEVGVHELMRYMAWGPVSGLALVAQISGQGEHKLYIALSGAPVVSMAVRYSTVDEESAIVWSPTGDRLLITGTSQLQVVTTEGAKILDLPQMSSAASVFSPCSNYVAALAHGFAQQVVQCSLRLFDTYSGMTVFDMALPDPLADSSLAFNIFGDQLVLLGSHPSRTQIASIGALTFGQAYKADHMSSRQVCQAIAGNCSRVELLLEGYADDPLFGDGEY